MPGTVLGARYKDLPLWNLLHSGWRRQIMKQMFVRCCKELWMKLKGKGVELEGAVRGWPGKASPLMRCLRGGTSGQWGRAPWHPCCPELTKKTVEGGGTRPSLRDRPPQMGLDISFRFWSPFYHEEFQDCVPPMKNCDMLYEFEGITIVFTVTSL